jgi:hypothetical protein
MGPTLFRHPGLDARSAVILVTLAVLGAGGCRTEKPVRPQVIVWRPVGSWAGRASLQTESFISDTGSFRVRWQARSDGPPEAGTLRVTLNSAVSGRPLVTAVDHRGAGQDTAFVNEDPREFFVVVNAERVEWTVALDEGIPATASGGMKD